MEKGGAVAGLGTVVGADPSLFSPSPASPEIYACKNRS